MHCLICPQIKFTWSMRTTKAIMLFFLPLHCFISLLLSIDFFYRNVECDSDENSEDNQLIESETPALTKNNSIYPNFTNLIHRFTDTIESDEDTAIDYSPDASYLRTKILKANLAHLENKTLRLRICDVTRC